jgi:hypothetical protein
VTCTCLQLLHDAGYAPRLYATFCNGLAYEYVPGVILDTTSCRDSDVFPLVAHMMALIHKVDGGNNVPKEPSTWLKIRQFLDIMPQSFENADKQARYEHNSHPNFQRVMNVVLPLLNFELHMWLICMQFGMNVMPLQVIPTKY